MNLDCTTESFSPSPVITLVCLHDKGEGFTHDIAKRAYRCVSCGEIAGTEADAQARLGRYGITLRRSR